MKKIKELMYVSACLLGMTAILNSCEDKPGPDPGPEPTPPALTGQTIMVPNETNVEVEVSMEMTDDWFVSNSNTWFTVYPLSGVAGTANLTITVLEDNPELTEKVSYFVINEGGTDKAYYVV